jgi:hypothetical protein
MVNGRGEMSVGEITEVSFYTVRSRLSYTSILQK